MRPGHSLDKLAKSFNIGLSIGVFPYDLPGKVDLNYVSGPASRARDIWSLKDETIKYCNLDCKILYLVIVKFNSFIFNMFELNAISYPTLSSLAFSIFRAHFLKDFKIPLLGGQIFKDIKLFWRPY